VDSASKAGNGTDNKNVTKYFIDGSYYDVGEVIIPFNAPVLAKISQISPNGLMLIDFNDTVVTSKNFTNLTKDMFDV